jgi:hypothetical protein
VPRSPRPLQRRVPSRARAQPQHKGPPTVPTTRAKLCQRQGPSPFPSATPTQSAEPKPKGPPTVPTGQAHSPLRESPWKPGTGPIEGKVQRGAMQPLSAGPKLRDSSPPAPPQHWGSVACFLDLGGLQRTGWLFFCPTRSTGTNVACQSGCRAPGVDLELRYISSCAIYISLSVPKACAIYSPSKAQLC